VSALATPGSRPSLLPRPLYACAGTAFLIAGAGVAVLNSVRPFEHGWWLASFWALVGGVAQALLGAGHRALSPPSSPREARHATIPQTALWSAGTLLVPLGVLTEIRLAVVVGSGTLVAVLARLAVDVRRTAPQPGHRVAPHRAWFLPFLAFMALSVLVGTALAWDLPWM
jgi:hypothetical protein